MIVINAGDSIQIKGTISDKQNHQITLEIKKNTFQLQHVSFFSQKITKFGEKDHFLYNFIPWTLSTVSLHGKISQNFGIKFCVYLSMKHIKPLE